MTDVVRILQDFSTAKNYKFTYGRKAVLNLLDNGSLFDGDPDSTYMLLEYRKIKPVKNATETGIKGINYEGLFYLVKQSDLDQNFFDEVGTEASGKYTNNIEPLLAILSELDIHFSCSINTYETLVADDITEFLDANMDGLMVNFKIYVPQ